MQEPPGKVSEKTGKEGGAPQPPVKERKPSDATQPKRRKKRKSDDTKINVPTVSKTRRTIKHRVV